MGGIPRTCKIRTWHQTPWIASISILVGKCKEVALILLPKSDRINLAKVAIDHVHSSAIRHSTTNSKYVSSRFCLATGLVNQKGTVDVCMVCVCVCVCFCHSWMEIRPNVVGKALGGAPYQNNRPSHGSIATKYEHERWACEHEQWASKHKFIKQRTFFLKYYCHTCKILSPHG